MPIRIPEGKVIGMLNAADGARKFLADEGNDGRVLTMVWVLVEGQLAEEFSKNSGNSVSVKVLGQSISVAAAGSKSGSYTIEMSANAAFAYKLHKVKSWTDKSKSKVEAVEANYKGAA